MRRKLLTQLSGGLQQSFIIRNKYLDVIANLSYLPGRPDKIRNGTGRPVPNINWEAFPPQVPSQAATDNPEPDYTDVFARFMRHSFGRSIEAAAHNQSAEKTDLRQCRNSQNEEARMSNDESVTNDEVRRIGSTLLGI